MELRILNNLHCLLEMEANAMYAFDLLTKNYPDSAENLIKNAFITNQVYSHISLTFELIGHSKTLSEILKIPEEHAVVTVTVKRIRELINTLRRIKDTSLWSREAKAIQELEDALRENIPLRFDYWLKIELNLLENEEKETEDETCS